MNKQIVDTIRKKLDKNGFSNIKVSSHCGGIRLSGELESYEDILTCGKLAVYKAGSRGVVNDIVLKGYKYPPMRLPNLNDKEYDGRKPDVLIIGGGIVGAAIARELSRYKLEIMLLEKEYDVAVGQSGRNDGMIHAGIDLSPSSLKAHYNMRGNRLYDKLSKELSVPIKKVGQYVLFTEKKQKLFTPFAVLKGMLHSIPVRYVNKWQIAEKVPYPGFEYGGIFCANAGIVSPYGMTIALAENAVQNGVEVCLNTAVIGMKKSDRQIKEVYTNRGTIYPGVVINAAGVWSDKIAEMAGDRHFTIHPRRGAEIILDKKAAKLTEGVVGKFVLKSSTGKDHTKGGGVVPTIDGNILVGPSAVETPERENLATNAEEVRAVFDKQKLLTPHMHFSDIITYFSGVRASTYEEDFIVERSPIIKNFLQAAGIQSPGVTSAPAIAEDIAKWTVKILGKVKKNDKFNPFRQPIPCPRDMKPEERNELIKQNPDFGEVVCRCEEVTKGEIIAALHSPIAVPTVDAVKRRTRAGMGRCQGGFCSPIITRIISEESGISIEDVMKKGLSGNMVFGKSKEAMKDEH